MITLFLFLAINFVCDLFFLASFGGKTEDHWLIVGHLKKFEWIKFLFSLILAIFVTFLLSRFGITISGF